MNPPPTVDVPAHDRATGVSGTGTAVAARITVRTRMNHGGDVRRRNEPITVGIPLPRGFCADPARLWLNDQRSERLSLQARPLDHWPDGTIRWALLDFHATTSSDGAAHVQLGSGYADQRVPPRATGELQVAETGTRIAIDTGAAIFEIEPGAFLFSRVLVRNQPPRIHVGGLRIRLADGASCAFLVQTCAIEERGPLRTVVRLDGTVRGGSEQRLLAVTARVRCFAGLATVRVDLTLRNPNRADHPGGFWELGDPGSVLLKEAALEFSIDAPIERVDCSPEIGAALSPYSAPFEIYQDSSGGEHWQSSNHVNRNGRIPLTFRGYRIRAAGQERSGLRASPVVAVTAASRRLAVATDYFWQNFPQSLEVGGDRLTLGLMPAQFADAHEIQGGEQKTYRVAIAFADDTISSVPLDWIRSPLLASADPEWYAATNAVPYLCAEADDPNAGYIALVRAGIEGDDTFEKKREIIDEYGWRNFGDVYADHEARQHRGPAPLVSHYNNQYDAIHGFGHQFLRTADQRWWRLMHELALHVVDIDIYHTDQDKSLYNGGPLWHTAHYTDSGRSTHRSFPRAAGASSGGPSAQHNYTSGLRLHYLLTGSELSRESAIGLARWVVNIDDGRQSVFRWLDRGLTGRATEGPFSYQGPTRAGANSLDALLDGHRLCDDPSLLDKAEQLIRRCIHPDDDLPARDLADVERRWSYTVFLEALGRYLDYKQEIGSLDFMFDYARASLLRYAAWMVEHEYPYLDKPELLEFPTETWAAQDIRKSEVFKFAAMHASDDKRPALLERADFFFRASTEMLSRLPTRTLARPVVLLLARGSMHAYVKRRGVVGTPPPRHHEFGAPVAFVTQRSRAIRKAAMLAGASATAAVGAAAWWLLG
jgi:exo-rhamnogalacturonan lyase-like protein